MRLPVLATAMACGSVPVALAQDPIKVDAQHHRVEIEDERARVLRVTLPPGATSAMHQHPASVTVFLTNGTLRVGAPGGQSRPGEAVRRGTTAWAAAETHSLENTGQAAVEMIVVELKVGPGQQLVSFPTDDGGVVHGALYGQGDRGVVLAHGGRFNKESWEAQARTLAAAGFRVLAIDFRGYGLSRGPGHAQPMDAPLHHDVLAAIRYLRRSGARTVSVVGGSMGGGAAAGAAARAAAGEIDRLVLLAAWGSDPPEKLRGRKLYIVGRGDLGPGDVPRLPRIREHYERATGPKELVVVESSAHAQFLFATPEADRVMREILRFLSEP